MKWSAIARLALPILSDVIPGVKAIEDPIARGIDTADRIFAADDGESKRQHVMSVVTEGATVAGAAGINVDRSAAEDATRAVFQAIDAIHVIVKANQARPTAGAAASASAAAPSDAPPPRDAQPPEHNGRDNAQPPAAERPNVGPGARPGPLSVEDAKRIAEQVRKNMTTNATAGGAAGTQRFGYLP